ncbi:hypothetical protein [Amycolatopsis vancoresmycina]|nr:hypothetical protein [Amycolatopsis vancoresmycina]
MDGIHFHGGRGAGAKVQDLLRDAGGLATAGAGLWTAVRALAAAAGVPR